MALRALIRQRAIPKFSTVDVNGVFYHVIQITLSWPQLVSQRRWLQVFFTLLLFQTGSCAIAVRFLCDQRAGDSTVIHLSARDGDEPTFIELEPSRASSCRAWAEPSLGCEIGYSTESSLVFTIFEPNFKFSRASSPTSLTKTRSSLRAFEPEPGSPPSLLEVSTFFTGDWLQCISCRVGDQSGQMAFLKATFGFFGFFWKQVACKIFKWLFSEKVAFCGFFLEILESFLCFE